jgi:5-methyltetrahydrofolate--homocysteine methyltransferase
MSFTQAFQTRRLLADGAMASELQKRGLPLHIAADQWSLSHPQAVMAVHQAYVAAGCDIILTNTLTANATTYGSDPATAINRAAVGIARQSGAMWVAGSMGPGADDTQALALAGAGVDVFWLETQLSLPQVVDSIAACRRASITIPIIVTFSFHQPTAITHTGETVSELAKILTDLHVCAIGANCGNGFIHLDTVVKELTQNSTLPVVLKPNAGIPEVEGQQVIYNLPPSAWVKPLTALLSPQVCIVGGCCGTTPAHLTMLHHLAYEQA